MDRPHLIQESFEVIDNLIPYIWDISLKIHGSPEIAFEEYQASLWLTDYLERQHFRVERGICNLPTSFHASFGEGQPRICLLAEYDALPELGHACGHNLISSITIGAAVALKSAIQSCGGSVHVVGTPAEEREGGKLIMAERGAFNDYDVVMMVHPGDNNSAITRFLARDIVEIEFLGQVNNYHQTFEESNQTLDALSLLFSSINALRARQSDSSRIHGIISRGGDYINVPYNSSVANFQIRAESEKDLDEVKVDFINCIKAAAQSTGCEFKYNFGIRCSSMLNNMFLARLFRINLQSTGRKVNLHDPKGFFGSSDITNVSQLVPSIHPIISIAPENTLIHTAEFAEYAVSELGRSALVDGIKAIAMTVINILEKHDLIERIRNEFNRRKKTVNKGFRNFY